MAIKGKKKPKRARRTRPVPPKPEVVVRKPPLVARRWFQVTVSAVLALLLGLVLGWGMSRQARSDKEEAEAKAIRSAATTYQKGVDAALAKAGSLTPAGFNAFPELAPAAQAFVAGSASPASTRNTAADVAARAKKAEEALAEVQIPGPGDLEERPLDDFVGSRDSMKYGLTLYRRAALLLEHAAEGSSETLAKEAAELATTAGLIFGQGYQRYRSLVINAGLTPAQAPLSGTPENTQLPPGMSPPPGFPTG